MSERAQKAYVLYFSSKKGTCSEKLCYFCSVMTSTKNFLFSRAHFPNHSELLDLRCSRERYHDQQDHHGLLGSLASPRGRKRDLHNGKGGRMAGGNPGLTVLRVFQVGQNTA